MNFQSHNVYVLGMDISPKSCGLYLTNLDFSVKVPRYVDLGSPGKILREEVWDNEDALWTLMSAIQGLCGNIVPVLSVIEDYAFGRPNLATSSGERGGVARLTASKLLRKPSQIIEIMPTTLKKFILGKGSGVHKPEIIKEMNALGFPCGTEHEADSGVLALIGVYLLRNGRFLENYRREVVGMLRNKYKIQLKQVIKDLV